MNPTRIARRITGTNADETRIAALLASRYRSETSATRSDSRLSAEKARIVAIPERLLASRAPMSPAVSRTRRIEG